MVSALLAPRVTWAEGPAVSQINGKIAVEGGEMNAHPAGLGEASLSVPLGFSFGAQFDAAGGVNNGQGLWGVAGQGFWRDPEQGLAGALALHSDNGHTHVDRYGGEGAAYLGAFTPEAAIGYQHGTKNGAFAVLDLAWYPVDDLRLNGGVDLNPGHTHALLGVEYQLGLAAVPGLAVFAEGSVSGQRDSYALTGVRLYLGPDKTLIRRHREDDPESPIVDQGLNNGQHAPPAPPPPVTQTQTASSNSNSNQSGSGTNSGSPQNGNGAVITNIVNQGGTGSTITNTGGGAGATFTNLNGATVTNFCGCGSSFNQNGSTLTNHGALTNDGTGGGATFINNSGG